MKIENYKEIRVSLINFRKHVQNCMIFPVLSNIEERFHNVHISISIGKDGKLENAKYEESQRISGQSASRNIQTSHITEALRIVNSYKGWVPNKENGNYQVTNKIVVIFFHYHKKLMTESDIVLNPDVRPVCLGDSWRITKTIEGKNGCDGMGFVLAIINEEGNPEELEIYNVDGKTNTKIVEGDFRALGKWSPARLNEQSVKCQIGLCIYT